MYEKYERCRFSVRLMFPGEDGRELREEGFLDDHGCEHPIVIETSSETSVFIDGRELRPVAILCGFGKRDDPEVVKALTRVCGNCRFFQTR